ncbi:J domain-containing protein [Planctomonas psychrotolerans]|uniref:J domain-containing protein n=1 Tax=Planctomonas psychrotolerans TaxID=2528712 RepID=UPI00123A93A1|nr:J domain-containing protein [Planctomonas psychrotolerans]
MNPDEAAGVLGLAGAYTRADILHAYSRSARLTHPDLLPDPTPDAVRSANERFIRLTLARDILLRSPLPNPSASGAPGSNGFRSNGFGPHGSEQFDNPPQRSDDVGWHTAGRRGKSRGMGGSIASVIALAVVLVVIVTLQDGWRAAQFGVVGRDLTANATVVSELSDGTDADLGCPAAGSCVLVELTSDEDCADAIARFEVTSDTDESTATRELIDLRADRPVEVAFAGTSARLIYLGCDE